MRSNLRHNISGLALISAYDKNISTRLKTELCSSDTNNYSYAMDVSTRNSVKSEHWCTSWGYQFKVHQLKEAIKNTKFLLRVQGFLLKSFKETPTNAYMEDYGFKYSEEKLDGIGL